MIVGLLLVGIVGAGILSSSLEQKKQELRNHKQNNTFDYERDIKKLKYVTDKICELNYETEEIDRCYVCVEYEYNSEPMSECIDVEIESTKKNDDDKIEKSITRNYKESLKEEFKYNKDNRK